MPQEHLASLLNLDECTKIVKKINQETKNNLFLDSFSIVSANDAKGFLGEYFHLKIQCRKHDNENELSKSNVECDAILLTFFVKHLPPVDEQHEQVRIFRKESSLYESLLPKLQKHSSAAWCPKVYLCYKNLLVLEDLNCLGLSTLDSKETLTENEMFPVLSGLAAMHAASLLYEFETRTCIGDVYGEYLKEITVDPEIPWLKTGITAIHTIAKRHPKYQTEELQQFITTKLPIHLKNIYTMVNPSPKYRNVLCHRDTWGGNIFLNYNNRREPAKFVDFQTCRYSPAAIDVIFTLYMNLTKREIVEKQSKYIRFYYQELVGHINRNIPSDKSQEEVTFTEAELLESVKVFRLFGLVYRALAISVLKVPKEFVTDHFKNVERSKKLLQYMNDNEEFNHLMNESIEDVIEAIADISINENAQRNIGNKFP